MEKSKLTKSQDAKNQSKSKSYLKDENSTKKKLIKAEAIKEVRIIDDAKWW
jgi:hypothetical protein